MKKLLFLTAIIAFTLISSCSKDDNSSNNNNNNNNNDTTKVPTVNYFLKCKVNGVLQNFKAINLAKDDITNPNYIILVAYANEGSALPPNLTITMGSKSPGWVKGLTYTLNENDQTSTAEFKDKDGFLYKSLNTPGNSGLNITFTEFDVNKGGKVGGIFSGSLQLEENTNTVQITEGTFLIKMLN
jgi:hypothetical protein